MWVILGLKSWCGAERGDTTSNPEPGTLSTRSPPPSRSSGGGGVSRRGHTLDRVIQYD